MPRIPPMLLALAMAVLVCAAISLPVSSRGGRFRTLPGWTAFWVVFGLLLVCLGRAPLAVSLPVLGLAMFGALREYFFLAPVRPPDRWAILFAYLTIPASLWPVGTGSYGMFLAGLLLYLFLVLPVILSLTRPHAGLLDSVGRVLLGLLVFVFCTAHLGWMAHQPAGRLELFGVLVLASELPQRLVGRVRAGEPLGRPLIAIAVAVTLAAALGVWLGRSLALPPVHAAVAGVLVAVAVAGGRIVTDAVAEDLSLDPITSRTGRGALLDRAMPAVYAAPLFFHYLQHFA